MTEGPGGDGGRGGDDGRGSFGRVGVSERLPAGGGAFAASLFAALGTLALAGVEWLTTLLAGFGVVWIAASYLVAERRAATLGAVFLYIAVIVAGILGVGVPTVLAAGAGTFLAWTFARTAAGLRSTMGHADTSRLELTHVAGTGVLAAAGLVVTYLPYRFGAAEVPPLGLAGFVVGAVLLTVSLRRFEG